MIHKLHERAMNPAKERIPLTRLHPHVHLSPADTKTISRPPRFLQPFKKSLRHRRIFKGKRRHHPQFGRLGKRSHPKSGQPPMPRIDFIDLRPFSLQPAANMRHLHTFYRIIMRRLIQMRRNDILGMIYSHLSACVDPYCPIQNSISHVLPS